MENKKINEIISKVAHLKESDLIKSRDNISISDFNINDKERIIKAIDRRIANNLESALIVTSNLDHEAVI